MKNGYVLCGEAGLRSIDDVLAESSESELDDLRSRLRIGLHVDVEVTDDAAPPKQLVSQAYCSALPVSYNHPAPDRWRRFATVVLEAAYEATLLARVLTARRGGSNIVLLTRLGGGAFGNDEDWIDGALRRALALCEGCEIDIRLVSFRSPPTSMLELERAMLARR